MFEQIYTEGEISKWTNQGRRQVKICGVDRHGEGGARAYNGGLEAEPTPFRPLVKFVSISGATSSKSWVDMCTPVHPVATPLERTE